MFRFQCFIDTNDICEPSLMILPNTNSTKDETMEHFDDYFLQIKLLIINKDRFVYLIMVKILLKNFPKKKIHLPI